MEVVTAPSRAGSGPREPAGREPEPLLASQLEELQRLQVTNPRQGLALGLHLRRAATRAGQDGVAAWATYRAAVCAVRLNRLPLGQRLHELAAPAFDTLQDVLGIAGAANLRGLIHEEQGQHGDSYRHFHAALLLSEQHGLVPLQGIALSNLALAARNLGDLETSLDWTNRSLSFAEQQGDTESVARTMTNAVHTCLSLGLVRQARSYAERAHDITRHLDHPGLESITWSNLGTVASAEGQNRAAYQAALQSVALEQRMQNERGVAYGQLQAAGALLAMKHWRRAAPYLRTVEGCGLFDTDPELHLSMLMKRSLLRQGEGNLPGAHADLTLAKDIAMSHEWPHLLTDILLRHTEVLEALGEYREALRTHRQYHEHDAALRDRQQSARTHALILTHEMRENQRLNAELTVLNEHLRQMADHDPLTGCLNRRAFLAGVQQVSTPHARDSVALLDIDHFKVLNDRFGHHVGDDVLRSVVDILRDQLRGRDLLCRWGGEEFVLLLRGTTPDQAALVCERLRQQVALYQFPTLPTGVNVTASFGISTHAPGCTLTSIQRADRALYRAKNAGRNQVFLANETDDGP